MFTSLMTSRRFAPLFWCQLCSALNDNFLKNALGMLILFGLGGAGAVSGGNAGTLITLSGIVFIAPFFILSALGGELADRFDKAYVAQRIRLAEIPIAAVAALGFFLHSVPILFVALALFGMVAALFGPVKYGILPEKLATAELPAGNALVEGATFLAILAGTIAGGIAVAQAKSPEMVVLLIVALAATSYLFARAIPAAGPAAPDLVITRNPWVSTMALLRELRADARLWGGARIVSWFWVVGFVSLSLLPALVKGVIGGTEGVVTLCLAVFTVGIAIGSVLAARASHGRPNLALVPMGALLMGLFCLAIASIASVISPGAERIGPAALIGSPAGLALLVALCGLAIAGGLFIVPAFAAVQAWAPADRRARVIAAVNVLNAAYMVAGGAVVAVLQAAGIGLAVIFTAVGILSIACTVLVAHAWGTEVLRDSARMVFQFFFRLEVEGLEHIPEGERVVIAPNHVSLLDGPILHAILPKQAAFAVNSQIGETWWVRPFLRYMRAHLLEPTRPLATRTLVNALKAGEMIVIFPEGRITITGGLMKAYDGAAMVADKADAWVVPVRIEGAERTALSYLRPTQIRKAMFPRIKVTFLPARKLAVDAALKGKARRQAAGLALQDIMVEAAVATARFDRTLFAALTDARATRDTGRPAAQRSAGRQAQLPQARARRAGAGRQARASGPRRRRRRPDAAQLGRRRGRLLRPAGHRPRAGHDQLHQRRRQHQGRLPRRRRHGDPHLAHLRDQGPPDRPRRRVGQGPAHRLPGGRARCRYLPRQGLRHPRRRPSARGAASPTILPSSSSRRARRARPRASCSRTRTCSPTAPSASRASTRTARTLVFNALPVFHSFGLTGGLIMPLLGGVPVFLYPSPLHYRIVPELVYDHAATIMFGTDTFLRGYARAAHPYDFRSLRLIVAGAEAVKDSTRQVFMDKFGVRILEGYGVTETAPVLAMNTPIASRSGTVGRLSPLMQARLEPVPGIAEGGRLYVQGPNVMLGYYRVENPGVLEAPADGWHDTGDIVAIDAQGFITIKGRAKRFAKIGGEMVSLSAAEALVAEACPGVAAVVVALPDPRKGERLVLVTTDAGLKRDQLVRHARAKGAAELMVPAEILIVESLPLLGSGKPDYVAATALAKARTAPAAQATAAA